MTKTTCPTCGTKCEVSEGRCLNGCECNCTKLHVLNYRPLPQPDLTKLREAYKEHIAVINNSYLGNHEQNDDDKVVRVIESARHLLQTLEELLEQEEKS